MKLSGKLIGKQDSILFKQKSEQIKNNIQFALNASAIIVLGQSKLLCPVDTGRLRASLSYRIKGKIAEVGTNVEYAAHVEYGTRYQSAQSYLRQAIDLKKKEIIDTYRKAIREGLK